MWTPLTFGLIDGLINSIFFIFMYLDFTDGGMSDVDGLGDDECSPDISRVISLLGLAIARDISRMVERRPLPIQEAVWDRVAATMEELDGSLEYEQKKAFVDHNFAMLQGGDGFDVIPGQSWTYPDGYSQSGNYYEFSRGCDTFGVVMVKYIYDVEANVPYCLIDHVQGIRQPDYDLEHDPFFKSNPLERMAEYVIKNSKPLLDGGWKLALKVEEALPILRRDSPFSFGVRDRFFESKPKEVLAKGVDMPGVALPRKLYELNPKRKRVQQILGV